MLCDLSQLPRYGFIEQPLLSRFFSLPHWSNRRLDANGDGDFTDAADRDEPAANNTFSSTN